ncbi:MAG: 4Fe-4S binding protein [Opitutaceae bacterium]
MTRRLLRHLRIVVALAVFVGFTAAFSDFRNLVPDGLGSWLASTQLVPSLMMLATGVAFSAGCLLVLLLTLAVGRVYCSALCPLGILQDIISRSAGFLRLKKPLLPHARPFTKLRWSFLGGTTLAVLAGWGALALALLDPYSNFGRIAAGLFRPLITLANNSVVTSANAIGLRSVYRIDVHWAGAWALAVPVVILALVTIMAALRGRLYCNTVCPVGTLLGFVSRHAAFRLRIAPGACVKCGQCLRHCKAQCIDLRAGTIDASRCVACYDCINACDEAGIGYAFAWKPSPSAPARPDAGTPSDPRRRTFLADAAAAAAAVMMTGKLAGADTSAGENTSALVKTGQACGGVVPPGAANLGRFLDRCTACHLCISACPTQVLRPALLEYGLAGLLKPRLDYETAFCNFDCIRCGEVCPSGAILPLAPADKQAARIGVADFHSSRCIVVTNGTDCAACSEHCPTKAVSTEPYGNNLRLPVLNQDACIGCGACEYACPVRPVKAIRVTGLRRHGRAVKLIEKKPAARASGADFPF